MYKLKNRCLEVDISNNYKRVRFDHVGMISKILYKETYTITGIESENQTGSGGQGLYNEFGIEEAIGYENESFLKIGVGCLSKVSDQAYDFFFDYPASFFDYQVEEIEQGLIFRQTSPMVYGYSYSYEKKISLNENNITVNYKLKNTGEKSFSTTEYCHNFLSINRDSIGPNYKIDFSYPISIASQLGHNKIDKQTLSWSETLEDVMYLTLDKLPQESHNYFELYHQPTGIKVRETHDFSLHKVAIWAMPHVVSPEAFIKISLEPNETSTWSRIYTINQIDSQA